jgi:hypothetical protein
MKRFIGIRLGIFFISAGMLYLYANNLFGKDKIAKKDISELTSVEACAIWKTINSLEKIQFETEVENTEYLGKAIARLMKLAAPYDELFSLVSDFTDRRLEQTMPENFNLEESLIELKRIKREILQVLNPVLNIESCEKIMMMVKVSWFTTAKLNFIRAMNQLYLYLFGAKSEDSVAEQSEAVQQ